ncbi:TRAP transporter substrate-binding protein [Phyllobacterium chamaecytisi]|uniref:TRAP transporter substrate-binding protein n=1 Tax=Phyllobacterium chamaecytisi TaxID=2876082 RepID=UPI001CD03C1E|nr:TRAP transporter substrate-binding protein [Phyllobacterium sp. KW56]MBZ9603234.1 TRAP transporter substrate-binding protein [Phyllobacterium sp. KW56]
MTVITRRAALAMASATIAMPFICGKASAAEYNFKLGLELRKDEPLPARMLEAVATIEEETDGRLKIRAFPNGALGNPVETLNQVRSGALEFLTSSFGILSTLDRTFGLPTLGFVFDDYDTVWQTIDGKLGQYIAAKIAARGELVVIDAIHDIGFRHVTSNLGVFNEPASLKGVRIRTPPTPFLTTLFSALGASPTPMAFGDLYTALQTGTVDAQENPLAVIESYKYYEVQHYCTLTGHTWDGWVPIANQRAWSRLPENIQQVVARNFRKSALKQREDIVAHISASETNLQKLGMKFGTPAAGVYQRALQATGFYSNWASNVGPEAWEVLQSSLGKSLR